MSHLHQESHSSCQSQHRQIGADRPLIVLTGHKQALCLAGAIDSQKGLLKGSSGTLVDRSVDSRSKSPELDAS
jgi:hypothetical protein